MGVGCIPSISYPCGCTTFIILKKQCNESNLVTDCRFPNKITINNNYLLPSIGDHFYHLVGDHDLTKIDLHVGFCQVCIKTIDSWETTSKTRFGLVGWFLMPFSPTNANLKYSRYNKELMVPL